MILSLATLLEILVKKVSKTKRLKLSMLIKIIIIDISLVSLEKYINNRTFITSIYLEPLFQFCKECKA